MKTAIYYFSGTGNSLAAARTLAEEIGESELFPIAKIMAAVKGTDKKLSPAADRIVIVFPVYVGGMPSLVAEFAARLKPLPDKPIYGVATYGGFIGMALHQLDEILRKNSADLMAGFAVNLPGNNITLYSAYSLEKQEKMFRIASLKLKKAAEQIKDGRKHAIEGSGALPRAIISRVYSKAVLDFKSKDSKFYSDDKCDGCGVCVMICPVKNISLKEGKPEWHHFCEQCQACIQWCPKGSIQHGKKTIKRKRYTHPKVKAEELMHYK